MPEYVPLTPLQPLAYYDIITTEKQSINQFVDLCFFINSKGGRLMKHTLKKLVQTVTTTICFLSFAFLKGFCVLCCVHMAGDRADVTG